MNEYNHKIIKQMNNMEQYGKLPRQKDSSLINLLAQHNIGNQSDLISGSKMSNTDASFEMKNSIYELKSIINNKCCQIGRLSKKLVDANSLIEQLKIELKQKNEELNRSGSKTKQIYNRSLFQLRNQLLEYSKYIIQDQSNNESNNLQSNLQKNDSQHKVQITLTKLIQFHKSAYPEILKLCQENKEKTTRIEQIQKNYQKQIKQLNNSLEQKNLLIGKITSTIQYEKQANRNYIEKQKQTEIKFLREKIKAVQNQNQYIKAQLEQCLSQTNKIDNVNKHKQSHSTYLQSQNIRSVQELELKITMKDQQFKQQKEKYMNIVNKFEINQVKMRALQAKLIKRQQELQEMKLKYKRQIHEAQINFKNIKNQLEAIKINNMEQIKAKDKQINQLQNNLKLIGIADKQQVYKRKIDFLSSQIKNLQKDIISLKETNEKLNDQLRKVETMNVPLTQQKKTLQQQLKKYEEMFQAKDNEEMSSFKQLRQVQSSLQQLKFKLKQLELTNRALEEQRKHSLQAKQAQISKNTALSLQCDSLRERNQQLKRMNKQTNKKFDMIEQLYKKLEQKYKKDVQNLEMKLETTYELAQKKQSNYKNNTMYSPPGRFTYQPSHGFRTSKQSGTNEFLNTKQTQKYFKKVIDKTFDETILSEKKSNPDMYQKNKQEDTFNIQFVTPSQDEKHNEFYSERLPPNYDSSNKYQRYGNKQRQNRDICGFTERFTTGNYFNQRHIKTEQSDNNYKGIVHRDSMPFQKIRDVFSSQRVDFRGKSKRQTQYEAGKQLKYQLDDKIQQLKQQNAKLMKKREQNNQAQNFQVYEDVQNQYRRISVGKRKHNQTMKDFQNNIHHNIHKNNSGFALPQRRIPKNPIYFQN